MLQPGTAYPSRCHFSSGAVFSGVFLSVYEIVFTISDVGATNDDTSENAGTDVTNVFTVTMQDACYSNELTCTELQDIDFLINADNSTPGSVD